MRTRTRERRRRLLRVFMMRVFIVGREVTLVAAIVALLGLASATWVTHEGLSALVAAAPSAPHTGRGAVEMGMMEMGAMDMSTSGGQGHAVSVAHLVGPRAAAHVRTFTLVARQVRLSLGRGSAVATWTYNGTAPGPVLRVRQGDLIVVHLVNRLPVPTTIHWHGVAVPNGEDGVAGSTQDAVAPGHTYTYRFIATDPGTYWYHSHQDSLNQVARGLYGMLVVTPAASQPHDDVDAAIALHQWSIDGVQRLAVNGSIGMARIVAQPGAWVRLRLLNTDNSLHVVTLMGVPFSVVALDGHALNAPRPLTMALLPIGSAQRYDVRFRMPLRGAVSLRLGDDIADDAAHGSLATRAIGVVGPHKASAVRPGPIVARTWFDLTTYGKPCRGEMTLRSHVDASYTLRLGADTAVSMLHPTPTFTINGLMSPNTTPLTVRRGEVVRLHVVNETRFVHPMHLHGHTLVVLARNGRPLRGSPVVLDTLAVFPHESYDVAFVANNPGIWMLHCHNLTHARLGMGLMVMYQRVTTPYHDGGAVGNVSD